jgi:hypothetical protein
MAADSYHTRFAVSSERTLGVEAEEMALDDTNP